MKRLFPKMFITIFVSTSITILIDFFVEYLRQRGAQNVFNSHFQFLIDYLDGLFSEIRDYYLYELIKVNFLPLILGFLLGWSWYAFNSKTSYDPKPSKKDEIVSRIIYLCEKINSRMFDFQTSIERAETISELTILANDLKQQGVDIGFNTNTPISQDVIHRYAEQLAWILPQIKQDRIKIK